MKESGVIKISSRRDGDMSESMGEQRLSEGLSRSWINVVLLHIIGSLYTSGIARISEQPVCTSYSMATCKQAPPVIYWQSKTSFSLSDMSHHGHKAQALPRNSTRALQRLLLVIGPLDAQLVPLLHRILSPEPPVHLLQPTHFARVTSAAVDNE